MIGCESVKSVMGKLKVKLPVIRQSLRNRGIDCPDETKQPKKKKSSKDRVKAYRPRLKNDPKLKYKNREVKAKKQEENKAYKTKLKEKRKLNQSFDQECKNQQRKWSKKSYEKRKDKKEAWN